MQFFQENILMSLVSSFVFPYIITSAIRRWSSPTLSAANLSRSASFQIKIHTFIQRRKTRSCPRSTFNPETWKFFSYDVTKPTLKSLPLFILDLRRRCSKSLPPCFLFFVFFLFADLLHCKFLPLFQITVLVFHLRFSLWSSVPTEITRQPQLSFFLFLFCRSAA